ncbi:SCP-like protein [Teladorsagia circumcincta]|uniref:SCP-like protein n=1 Tax=Teladorsagia circumcincta TaxID=45464 RepID=A0A2G9UUQ4_TELCI|nr:SCP-like protein [Teladorsagia circumcincta]
MTETLREKIILMHNFRRSRLAQGLVPNGLSDRKNPSGQNIYNMSYSTTLESEAQMYANACPESGSPAESRTTGENFGTVPTSSAKTYYDAVVQAIKAFWHEIIVTEINKEMKFTYMLTQRNLTRFTQMAWAKTYEVGCGANLCGENYVVVCRYNPRNSSSFRTRGQPSVARLQREEEQCKRTAAQKSVELIPRTSQGAMLLILTTEGDTYLELYAAINADGTCQSSNFFPPGGSLNFYTENSNYGELVLLDE